VTDPKRLIDEGSAFERELLRAGRKDAVSQRSALAITAALGVAAPIAATSALGTAGTAGTASAAASGGKLVTVKTALAIAGAGAMGALTVWGVIQLVPTDAPPPAPRVETKGKLTAPAFAGAKTEPVAPVETAQPEPAKAPAPIARAPVAAKTDTLPLEFETIDGARSALARGDAQGALALLDRYAKRFPKPRLGAEATVLRIEALAASGRRDEAVRLGKALLTREPRGPYARRVRSLIGAEKGKPPR